MCIRIERFGVLGILAILAYCSAPALFLVLFATTVGRRCIVLRVLAALTVALELVAIPHLQMACSFDVVPVEILRTIRRLEVVVDVGVGHVAGVLQDLVDVHLDLLREGSLDVLEAVLLAELVGELVGLLFLSSEHDDVLCSIVSEVNCDSYDLLLALRSVV